MIAGVGTVSQVLRSSANAFPAKLAVEELRSGRRLTYRELDEAATRLATALASAGVGLTERVTMCLPNGLEFLISSFGIMRSGAIATYINFRASATEAAQIFGRTGSRFVVTTDDRVEWFMSDIADSETVVLSVGDELRSDRRVHRFDEFYSTAKADAYSDHEGDPDADCLLRFTSGTTGEPKGVFVSHRGWLTRAAHLLAEETTLPGSAGVLVCGPLTHASGLLTLPCLMRGGTLYILGGFSTDAVREAVTTRNIVGSRMVPTMVQRVLDDRRCRDAVRNSCLQITYGGAPMPRPTLEEALDAFGPTLTQTYGSHEAGTMTRLTPAEHHDPSLLDTVGRPLTNVRIRMGSTLDGGGAPIEVSSPWTSTATLVDGARKPMESEWVRTGDIGTVDGRGYLRLLDRESGVIITGGFNVHGKEVEAVLNRHEQVREVAVIGIPDQQWGERVVAVVVCREPVTEAELIEYSHQFLAGYKCPKNVYFIEHMPYTPTGKLDQKGLKRIYS